MNNFEKQEVTQKIGQEALPDSSETKTEKPKKKKSPPRSPAERLNNLYTQRERAISDQTEAQNKAKKIDEQIAGLKREMHENEVREFDKFCAEKDVPIKEVRGFLSAVLCRMSLSEAAKKLDLHRDGESNAG